MKTSEIMPPLAQTEASWQRLLAALPVADLETSARAAKALQRTRQITSAFDLLRLIFVVTVSGASLRLAASWALLQGVGQLSAVAVRKRLQGCTLWLGLLTAGCLIQRQQTCPLPRVTVRLVDATVICQPGSMGTDWRVHLVFDLAQQCMTRIELTDCHGGETLCRHATSSGCITIGDRGYAHPRGLAYLAAQGGWCIIRSHWQNLPLRDKQGQRVDMAAWLRSIPAQAPGERPVWLTTQQGLLSLRLVAVRLSEQAAEAARRRIRHEACRKKRTPDPRSLLAAGFLYLVSTVPADLCTAEMLVALYRLRWQVEIQIKRLKGVWQLGHVRTKDTALVQTCLLGTLLAALLAEAQTLALRQMYGTWFSDPARPVSGWLLATLWRRLMEQLLWAGVSIGAVEHHLSRLGRHLQDSPRRRAQQATQARRLVADLQLLS